MNSRFKVLICAALAVFLPKAASAQLRRIEPTDSGIPAAVVVKNRALIHTTQLLPLADDGKTIVGGNDAGKQFDRLLDRLKTLLAAEGSSLNEIVKLNVYVTSNAVATTVRKRMAKRFDKAHRPATAFVVTPLPHAQALVAFDAVAATTRGGLMRNAWGPLTRVVVSPKRGRLVYISGQAERKGDLAEATRATMRGLYRTIKEFKGDPSRVVQVKTFFNSMQDVKTVDHAIAGFFARDSAPPISHVEWTSRLIEIEMVLFWPYSERDQIDNGPVHFHTPNWMKSSPVFSRTAIVDSEEIIYISGLYGRKDGTAAQQVGDIFKTLLRITAATGSDLKHLAKATYYVSDNATSGELNKLRPRFYDPARPPAASKAAVAGVGSAGRGITLDMIAVPKR